VHPQSVLTVDDTSAAACSSLTTDRGCHNPSPQSSSRSVGLSSVAARLTRKCQTIGMSESCQENIRHRHPCSNQSTVSHQRVCDSARNGLLHVTMQALYWCGPKQSAMWLSCSGSCKYTAAGTVWGNHAAVNWRCVQPTSVFGKGSRLCEHGVRFRPAACKDRDGCAC